LKYGFKIRNRQRPPKHPGNPDGSKGREATSQPEAMNDDGSSEPAE
jgi:hypothetical protein